MKVCKKCNLEKDLSDFYFRKDSSKYRNDCKECFGSNTKDRRLKNPDYMKDYLKEWNIKNPEYNSSYCKEWRLKNPKSYINYYNDRIKVDNLFKVRQSIRKTISSSFRNTSFRKSSKTAIILGCSFEEFKLYLESNFEPWMNWENKGLYNGKLNYGWDIDHKIPVSSATTEEELVRLNHYTNLQPLCSKINRDIKKNKITTI
jgi:hypothetical protein